MSMFSKWWKKESTKVLLKAAVTILKTIAFGIGQRLWDVTRSQVELAATLPVSNEEKVKFVWKRLDQEFKELPGYIGNLAIELAVAHYKETLVK